MGNSLRCCLACVLPCGALDVIRVVHINGQVEEFSRPVTAGEFLRANPGHVLSKPCSQGVVRKILVVSPDAHLKRGNIYFLIPESSLPEKSRRRKKTHRSKKKASMKAMSSESNSSGTAAAGTALLSVDDSYPSEVLSEKKPAGAGHRRRRSGRVNVWRPHLPSISEDP